jgi:hypothetical protein
MCVMSVVCCIVCCVLCLFYVMCYRLSCNNIRKMKTENVIVLDRRHGKTPPDTHGHR